MKVVLSLTVDYGFHVNSNKPADEFLIPLKLTWSPGQLEGSSTTFPKPRLENYPFSTKPVSVFTGKFEIVNTFKVARNAEPGETSIAGKLHYQACNDHECLAPKTLDVTLPVEIAK